ncbi:unnamed protein product [[Candida] boidinii]|uniref:Unnamed protein product n=1 Tax=Candida boidinii TaxID=5477 RepID=A0ACB5UBS9_CANBO|nr:unnamed protein product [[Candida] boidinii]GMF06604.1 unnamed protein product [[Candida] boidinii]
MKTPSINREGQSSFVNETPKSISHRRTQSELIIPSSPKLQKVDANSNTITANSLSFSRENDSANTSILKSPSATPTPAKTRSSIRRSTPSFLNKILGPNQD